MPLVTLQPPAPPPALEARLTIRLDHATLARLQDASRRHRTTPSALIRHLLEQALSEGAAE